MAERGSVFTNGVEPHSQKTLSGTEIPTQRDASSPLDALLTWKSKVALIAGKYLPTIKDALLTEAFFSLHWIQAPTRRVNATSFFLVLSKGFRSLGIFLDSSLAGNTMFVLFHFGFLVFGAVPGAGAASAFGRPDGGDVAN